ARQRHARTPPAPPDTDPPPPAATDEPPSGESPSAGTGEIDLFNTAYAPADGADGETAIVGDWQEATQFNPYYLTQVTEANVGSAAWATLAPFTDYSKYSP